tara:strand:- start:2089 stop:2478 length:390 start_codon:yes stop_codon:yes gene_type:complete
MAKAIKRKKTKKSKPINYDIGPAYSATSKSRSVTDKKYHHKASGSGLDSKLYQNPDGSYTRKSVDSSPAEYNKGGKIKTVKKYKKGGAVKDACYHKVKSGEKVFPSAYASGRIAICRKMGAANYGKGKK